MMTFHHPDALPSALRERFPLETAYIEQFAQVPSTDLICNASTTVQALAFERYLMPITVDSPHAGNSYIVSPCCLYVDYALLELHLLPNRPLQSLFRGVIGGLGRWLQHVRLDDVVHVNNWLVSTNLYPDWDGECLGELTRFLIERFPGKAIAFRSINAYSNSALLKNLTDCGYLLLPTRQIYIQDARSGNGRKFSSRRDFKTDARLFAQTGHRVQRACLDGCPDLFEQLEHLYGMLYLKKYPSLNPRFTGRWLENGHREKWLNLYTLHAPDGRIDGVAGYLKRDETVTTPIVGYDTALPQSLGLYRMLTWFCLNEAIQNGWLLNCSAGAASFKRSRGAVPQVEYSAVYTRHLDPQRRHTWKALASLLNRIAVPLLHRFEL